MQVHRIQLNNQAYSYRNSGIDRNMAQRESYNNIQPLFEGSLPIELRYPAEFKDFQSLVKTDNAFKRFKLTNCSWDERLMLALSKAPDKLKKFAKMEYDCKSPGACKRGAMDKYLHPEMENYLLNMFQVIELTEASENYYNEILNVMNNSGTWGHIDQVGDEYIIKIAKLMKLRPEIMPSVENIFKSRKGSGKSSYKKFLLSSLLSPSKQDLLYPYKFVNFVLKEDKNHKFILTDDDIRKLAPHYLKNPVLVCDSLDKGNMKADDIIAQIVKS